MKTSEQRYLPSKEICDKFDITGSTLRKWCIALEKQSYEFVRTEQNRRLFVENDIEALEHLRQLVQGKNMTLENASIIVASRYSGNRSSTGTPSVLEENNEDSRAIAKLTEHIQQQEKFNQVLLKRLDEQSEYINKRLDQRDKALMETMNKLAYQRKEEIKLLKQSNEKKSSWFTKLFKEK